MKNDINNCWSTIGIWSQEHSCPRLKEVIHCHNCDVYHQATSYVYDAPMVEEYRDECTRVLREHKKTEKIKSNSVLTFEVYGEWLAIPTRFIKEITSHRPFQRIPHNKNKFVNGIVNIAGEIKLCFSLEKILGLTLDKNDRRHKFRHVVIAEFEANHYVFPVTQLGEVHRYHDDDFLETPSTRNESSGSFMHGIVRWKHQQVGVIDAELLFSTVTRSM